MKKMSFFLRFAVLILHNDNTGMILIRDQAACFMGKNLTVKIGGEKINLQIIRGA